MRTAQTRGGRYKIEIQFCQSSQTYAVVEYEHGRSFSKAMGLSQNEAGASFDKTIALAKAYSGINYQENEYERRL